MNPSHRTRLATLLTLASVVAMATTAEAIPHRRHRRHAPRHRPAGTQPAPTAQPDDGDDDDNSAAPDSQTTQSTSGHAGTVVTTTTRNHGGATEPPPPPPPSEPGPPRPVAIDVGVGFRGFSRGLTFTSDLFGVFRPYQLDFGPSIDASLAFYPVALFNAGPLAHIGLVGAAHFAFGIASRPNDEPTTTYPTESYGVRVGLRGRIPIATSELGILVGWGTEHFAAPGSSSDNDPGLPTTNYQFIHAGLDTRIVIVPRFGITGSFEYLVNFGLGDLTRYFPRASAGGLEASLGVFFVLGAGFELRASGGMTRFFYDMHTHPGDAYVAGGALDQSWSGTFAVAWRH